MVHVVLQGVPRIRIIVCWGQLWDLVAVQAGVLQYIMCGRGLNNCQLYGPICLISSEYHVPQKDLKLALVIYLPLQCEPAIAHCSVSHGALRLYKRILHLNQHYPTSLYLFSPVVIGSDPLSNEWLFPINMRSNRPQVAFKNPEYHLVRAMSPRESLDRGTLHSLGCSGRFTPCSCTPQMP